MTDSGQLDYERLLLEEIRNPEKSRKCVTVTYSMAVRSGQPVKWAMVHHAILYRWRRPGLTLIQREARKLIEEAKAREEREDRFTTD